MFGGALEAAPILFGAAHMGWENYHLYRFEIGGLEYTDPDRVEEFYGKDSREVRLSDVVLRWPTDLSSLRKHNPVRDRVGDRDAPDSPTKWRESIHGMTTISSFGQPSDERRGWRKLVL